MTRQGACALFASCVGALRALNAPPKRHYHLPLATCVFCTRYRHCCAFQHRRQTGDVAAAGQILSVCGRPVVPLVGCGPGGFRLEGRRPSSAWRCPQRKAAYSWATLRTNLNACRATTDYLRAARPAICIA